ncbi:MAG: hypothetical protein H6737_05515 [Alphaproteobacteria bacterium]|nr:hypothetical protein [Alphaproteobacteria bacterium]
MAALEAAECPQCGAGVRVPDGQLRVDCPYCHTTLFVRDGLLHVVHHRVRTVALAVAGSSVALLVALGVILLLLGRPAPGPVVMPVPRGPAVTVTNPEPDYLGSPEAMAGILERVKGATEATGRFKYLSVSADRTAVALAEVGPGAIDSIAMSWGHTVVNPVPLTEEERERLQNELFALSAERLRDVPALLERTLAAQPEGTAVERVDLLAIAGPPRIEIQLTHPRHVLEPVRVDL